MMEKVNSGLRRIKVGAAANYQQILALITVAVTVLIVYGEDLQIVMNEALLNDSLSHILLVPFLAGLLFYFKRDVVEGLLRLENARNRSRKLVDLTIGVVLCLAAFLVYWYSSFVTSDPLGRVEYHMLTLPIMLAGFVLILFNGNVLKVLILPVLFSLFLVPIPFEFTYTLGGIIGNFNTQASFALLKLFGLPVILIDQVAGGAPMLALETSGSPIIFTVDMACSGIYTITVFGMFAVFLAIVISASLPKKALMVAVGFVLLAALNVLRISITVSLAHWLGEETAMLLFHSVGGLAFIFVGMLLTLYFGKKTLHIQMFSRKSMISACPKCDSEARVNRPFCSDCGRQLKMLGNRVSREVWLKLAALLLGCSVAVMSVTAPTFAIAQNSIGVASTWENATGILPPVITYQNVTYVLTFNYRDPYYEKVAHQDASLVYTYNMTPTLFVSIGVSSSISNLHNWEVCLISWQVAQGAAPSVNVLVNTDNIELLQDVQMGANYLVFEKQANNVDRSNYTQSTLYWFLKAPFRIGATVQQKYVRISLIMYSRISEDYQGLREKLLLAGETIASYWKPLTEKSLISLGVPTMQTLLVGAAAFAGLLWLGDYSNQSRKESANRRIFNNFASTEEKLWLQTILEQLKERKYMRTNEILEILRKCFACFDARKGLVMLKNMEEHGFLKRDVKSFGNEAMLIWKT